MPRVKSSAKEQIQPGFGIQEGIIKFVSLVFSVVEYVRKDGTSAGCPFVARAQVQQLDEKHQALNEEESTVHDFMIGWPSRSGEGSDEILTYRLRPGNSLNAEDEDPEDLGEDDDQVAIGTEGNTIYADEGVGMFADQDWPKFLASLEKEGFKPAINDQSYGPNYEGLVVRVKTEGRKYIDKKTGEEKNATFLTVTEIHENFPYDGKASKGKAKPKATKTTKAKATPKAEKASAGVNGSSDLDDLFAAGYSVVCEANEGEELKRSKFQTDVKKALTADDVPMPQIMKVVGAMRKSDWIKAQAETYGFQVDVDAGTVTFP